MGNLIPNTSRDPSLTHYPRASYKPATTLNRHFFRRKKSCIEKCREMVKCPLPSDIKNLGTLTALGMEAYAVGAVGLKAALAAMGVYDAGVMVGCVFNCVGWSLAYPDVNPY